LQDDAIGSLADRTATLRENIDRLIAAFFAAFDNRNGTKPTLIGVLGCFAEKAVIARSGSSGTQLYTAMEFAAPRMELLASGTLLDFHEAEDSSSTSILGNLAIRTSRYRKSGILHGAPYAGAGTKHFQLLAVDSGWRILSLAWADDEA
jgi:predicted RecB family endonuclease